MAQSQPFSLISVGFSMVMVNALVSIYYNVIITDSLYYMFASMQSPLPWSSCFSWADSNCGTTPKVYCNISGVLVTNWTQENNTCFSTNKITIPVQSPSEEYWESSGLDKTGPVVWHLALCLLLSSMLVAAALIRGIKSSGKVVYFTATFPYVVILILLIRGVTLEGAKDGIDFYIGSQSNLTKLTEGQVILIWSLITFVPPTYGKVQYPDWGLVLGWCMVASILIWIPNIAVYKLIKAEGNLWKRLMSLCSPSEEWHPYLEIHRGERYSEERCRQRSKR